MSRRTTVRFDVMPGRVFRIFLGVDVMPMSQMSVVSGCFAVVIGVVLAASRGWQRHAHGDPRIGKPT